MADPIYSATIERIEYNEQTRNGQAIRVNCQAMRQLASVLANDVAIMAGKIDGGGANSGDVTKYTRFVEVGDYTSNEFAQDSYTKMNEALIAVNNIVATLDQTARKHGF